jgi:hypothetical protein
MGDGGLRKMLWPIYKTGVAVSNERGKFSKMNRFSRFGRCCSLDTPEVFSYIAIERLRYNFQSITYPFACRQFVPLDFMSKQPERNLDERARSVSYSFF